MPLRVLVISSKYPPEYAGSGYRAHNTYKRLAQKYDIRFEVISSSIVDNTCKSYLFDGVRVTRIANKASLLPKRDNTQNTLKRIWQKIIYHWRWQHNYWREAVPVIQYLKRHINHYDVIHIFGNVAVTSAAISFAKAVHKPLIVELVNLVDNPNQYEPWIITKLIGPGFPSKTLIICLSEHLKQICINHGYSPHQIWCRPNPINERKFHIKATKQKLFKFDASDIIILHLAKFMPRKNQRFMIDVLSLLPSEYKLVLAGPLIQDGPLYARDHAYYNSIQQAVEKKQLEDRVQLIPKFINNPADYMRASNIFVLPAEGEAFGTPFIEAIACGLPVVVNNLPGVFDTWIKPGFNGFICPLDAKLWSDKILQAYQISQPTRIKASKEILKKASTDAIDKQYYHKLETLVKMHE